MKEVNIEIWKNEQENLKVAGMTAIQTNKRRFWTMHSNKNWDKNLQLGLVSSDDFENLTLGKLVLKHFCTTLCLRLS